MITVTFHSSGSFISGYEISGHAMTGTSGNDIVCAAVSSAAYMAANTVTDVLLVNAEAEAFEGYMRLEVPDGDREKANTILSGFKMHITELAKQYPKNIKIQYTEV